LDLNGKVNLLRAQKAESGKGNLTIQTMAQLLEVNRTSIYWMPARPSEIELQAKRIIDEIHTKNPTWGSRQLSKQLKERNLLIGRLKTRRYMEEMGIRVIYPKPDLSKPAKGHEIYPYLLKNAQINRINQAWSIDITYIRLKHGFIYLTAIIDWHSRCIVGWELDDTLATPMVLRAVEKALAMGKPEILNSDQGSQFTSHDYTDFLKANQIQISMDGKGRWADNILIERWFRTLKYEEVYLKDYRNIKEARQQIAAFIDTYNYERLHSALDYQAPATVYQLAPLKRAPDSPPTLTLPV